MKSGKSWELLWVDLSLKSIVKTITNVGPAFGKYLKDQVDRGMDNVTEMRPIMNAFTMEMIAKVAEILI